MNISVLENIHMATTAVWTHRFRSLLTILGIVIGITTVVTVASLLTGLRQGSVVFFPELGPDNIFLFKTSGNPDFPPPKEAKRRPLKPEYADYIRKTCTSVADVGLELLIPAAVNNQPITARVPASKPKTSTSPVTRPTLPISRRAISMPAASSPRRKTFAARTWSSSEPTWRNRSTRMA